jgi:hypothetical protein
MPTSRTDEPRDVILTANMTLRDYFAAQVVAHLYEQHVHDGTEWDDIAGWAYRLADALLRAREAQA